MCCLDHPDLMPAICDIDQCTGHLEQFEQDLVGTDLLIRLSWDLTLPQLRRLGPVLDAG